METGRRDGTCGTLTALATVLAAAMLVAGCAGHSERSVPRSQIMLDGGPSPLTYLTTDVCRLASDSLGGRLVGTPGIDLAAEYIATQFSQARLKPLFGDSYYQEFPIQFGFEIEGHPVFRIEDAPIDYSVLPIAGSGTVWGGVAVGTAASDPKDARLAGKLLLVWEHPELERQRWTMTGRDALLEWMKEFASRAAEVKAAAVVFVNGSREDPDAGFHLFAVPKTYAPAPIPCLEVRHSQLRDLLAGQGISPDSLDRVVTSAGRSRDWQDLERIQSELGLTTRPRTVIARNVGGLIPGEAAGGEFVVVGAHYDGLGSGDIASSSPWRREVHNGADDNASGVGALLLAARKVAANPAPARSIAFVCFTAEELGALGSEHFCADSPFPIDSVVVMINLDTVGRLEDKKLIVFGAKSAAEFSDLLAASGRSAGLDVVEREEVYGFSDQNPFYARGIPSMHFFTGAYETYHTPDDDCSTVNFQGLKAITALTIILTKHLAGMPARPTPVVADVTPPAGSTARGRGGSLGIVPDFAYGGDGIRIKGTVPKSPAELAGLQDGDILVAIDGQPLEGLKDLMTILGGKNPGDQITVEVSRGSEVLKKEIILSVRSAN